MITPDEQCLRNSSKFIKKNKEDELVFMDIGSNKGEWTDLVLNLITQTNKCKIHLFEPNPACYDELVAKFGTNSSTKINNFGVSSKACSATLFDPKGVGSALSSLYDRKVFHTWTDGTIIVEKQVNLVSLDDYVELNNIDHIHFLKIDVEGHELEVLRGARKLFEEKKVNVGQFEVGGTFSDAGICIKDFIDFFADYNYGIYFKEISKDCELKTNVEFEWENILFANKSLDSSL